METLGIVEFFEGLDKIAMDEYGLRFNHMLTELLLSAEEQGFLLSMIGNAEKVPVTVTEMKVYWSTDVVE